ncbi:MAG: murein biosynthesis integral membrane protein MurJ [Solirubrobacteraceae bacterium]
MSASTPAARRAADTGQPGRVARNTAIFSIATAFSRVAGLIREIVAAALFGTTPAASAFTLAFQIPNLVANLFANAALSAAFVPVFTDLLRQGKRREAMELASSLLWIMLIALAAITAFFVLAAGVIMPLFLASSLSSQRGIAVLLSQILFPVVLLLGLTSLFTGILQSFQRFTMAAVAPAIWNLVIIVLTVYLHPKYSSSHYGIEAYAIAILAATVVQMLLVLSALTRIDFRLSLHINRHDPRVRQVFALMLPVTIGLGIVNLDQLINSAFGGLVNAQVPRAIDQAFRIYMLPQGIFSVAVATVLFPTLSRMASERDPVGMRRALAIGMRQINLMLIPAAAFLMVFATPVIRLVYQHGQFNNYSTHLASIALIWFAASLPFGGLNLLLTRTFFALQRPWIPTGFAALNMTIDIIISLGFYKPFGISGLILGTLAGNVVMTVLLLRRLRTGFNGRLEGPQTLMITARVLAASAFMALAAWLVWRLLDAVLGGSVPAQVVEVGGAAAVGGWLYMRTVLRMKIPEAFQVEQMLFGRFRRS